MIEHEMDDIQPGPSKFKDYGTNTIYDWEHDTPSFDFKVDLIELNTSMIPIGVGEARFMAPSF